MMANRELYIIGTGAFLAVLCLLPQWDFTIKVALALILIVISLVIAMARFEDGRPIEFKLYHMVRSAFKVSRYTYTGATQARQRSYPAPSEPKIVSAPSSYRVVDFSLHSRNVYWVVTMLLVVLAIYITYWAYYLGGLKDITFWVRNLQYTLK